jgi:type IV pilus assembly protein PilW
MTVSYGKFGKQAGFSLIEMMVAVVIAGLLLVGIVSLFSSTSNLNRLENGLARLQENGRFALAMIQKDIRLATGTGGIRKGAGESRDRLEPDLSVWSLVDMSARAEHGLPGPDGGATAAWYQIPRSYMFRGFECASSGCTPELGATGVAGEDLYGGGLPATGVNAGSRAAGSDVLTLRYLRSRGVNVDPASSLPSQQGAGSVTLENQLTVGPSRLVIFTDFQSSLIVSVAETGATTTLTPAGNISNDLTPLAFLKGRVMVADFDSEFLTVSYYLQLAEDPSAPGRMISSLVRRENGRAEEIAQGIERLDFTYHIESGARRVFLFDAAQVANSAASFDCVALDPNDPATSNLDRPYCVWRSVRAVDVHLLANSVTDAGTSREPFNYSFLASGQANPDGIVELACDPSFGACPGGAITELPSGLRPGRMLRREFRTTALLRNNAY